MWNRLATAFRGAFSLNSLVITAVHTGLVFALGLLVPGLVGMVADAPTWAYVAIGFGSALLSLAYILHRWDRKNRPSDLDGLTGPDGVSLFTQPDLERRFPTGARVTGYKREQLPNWKAKHSLASDQDLPLDGVWLEVFSTDRNKRQVYRCQVLHNDNPAGLWDATKKPMNAPLDEWEPVAHEKLLYPSHHFAGAPTLPLGDGDYRIEWFAVRDQLGRQLVAFDRFEIVDGALADAEKRKDKGVTWTNMYAADDSLPVARSLRLRLTHIGDRWSEALSVLLRAPTVACGHPPS